MSREEGGKATSALAAVSRGMKEAITKGVAKKVNNPGGGGQCRVAAKNEGKEAQWV